MSRPHSTSFQSSPVPGKHYSASGEGPSGTLARASNSTSALDNRSNLPRPEPESRQSVEGGSSKKHKRRRNRNKKRRNRRPSFLVSEDSQANAPPTIPETETLNTMAEDSARARASAPFYKVGSNLSNTSMESEALLDHRYVGHYGLDCTDLQKPTHDEAAQG